MKTQMTNKTFIFSTLALLPLLFYFSKNNTPAVCQTPIPKPSESISEGIPADPCSTKNTAFQTGEELTYKIFYNLGFVWIAAAELTFRVIDDDDQYHYQVVGETYESYDWFFKVRDYYDTWVQKDNLLPMISIRNVLEGKYTLYDYNTFDQFRKTCYNERGRSKATIKEHNQFKVENCMHDMVSILYYARNIKFKEYKEGQKFPIKIFVDKKTWPLQVTYQGQEAGKEVKGQGKYNTLKFRPEIIKGDVFPDGGEMNIWVTDDQNLLPLIIESPLKVGKVKAILKSHKGLRYPVMAKQ